MPPSAAKIAARTAFRERMKRRGEFRLVVLAFGVEAAVMSVPWLSFHPLRSGEAAIIVAIVTSPIWIALTWFVPKYVFASSIKQGRKPFYSYFHAAIISAGLMLDGVAFCNARLDHSAPASVVLTVVGKRANTYRGTTTYAAYVPSPVPKLLPIASETEKIPVSDARTFAAVQVGVTQVVFGMHPGFFGLPWRESEHLLLKSPATL